MNIIELAKQAGFVEYELDDGMTEAFVKRYAKFANLVAAAARADEREKCALLCINIATKPSNVILGVAIDCADAIRARGTT